MPKPSIDGLKLAAVDGNETGVQKINITAKRNELPADFVDRAQVQRVDKRVDCTNRVVVVDIDEFEQELRLNWTLSQGVATRR